VATALHWLLQAADAGFVTSQQALGELYESGRLGWKDLPQAVAWYRRAAEAGSPQAQLEMGTACFLGRGTPQDLAQAAQWYRQAALAGDLGAMYILASMYEKGEGWTPTAGWRATGTPPPPMPATRRRPTRSRS
jgi:TPR repeat protein